MEFTYTEKINLIPLYIFTQILKHRNLVLVNGIGFISVVKERAKTVTDI